MPPPRPFVDPFSGSSTSTERQKLNQDEENDTKRSRVKAVAPISASAFSFQLGSSLTPRKAPTEHNTKREPSDSRRHATPLSKLGDVTPGPSRKNEALPLRSLPSPFGLPGGKGTSMASPSIKLEVGSGSRRRVSDMAFGSAKALGKRKAEVDGPDKKGEEDESKNVGSPVSVKRAFKALGQLGSVNLGQNVQVQEVKKRVEEEGIGVSPRGKKIVKYSGKGPPPLSIVLGNALSSQQSSLVLFYASLQQTLYPTRTPKKSRMTPSALTEGALKPIPKGPTVLQHLRTAPLVLRAKEAVKGRTGWSVMCRCQVLRGQAVPTDLGPATAPGSSTSSERVTNDNTTTDGFTTDALRGKTDTHIQTDILAVLQPLPPDCVKLGLDARIMALRPPDGQIAYEIGIWPAWSDMSYDPGIVAAESDLADPETPTNQPVVFATRYLIAQSDSDTSTSTKSHSGLPP